MLISLVILFTGCNKNRNSENSISQVPESRVGIPEQLNEITLVQPIDSTYNLIEITEYLQYKKLIDTYILRDSIIRIQKDWHNGNTIDTILEISTPNILSRLSALIKEQFPRSASYTGDDEYPSYFVYLNITSYQGDKIEVSFTNCRSQGLVDVFNIINSAIPSNHRIITKGKYVIDNVCRS